MTPSEKLISLGLSLPMLNGPVGNYMHAVRAGNLLFLAGKGMGQYTGKVGAEVTLAQAREYARTATLALLAVVEQQVGSLDKVTGIVKISGFVNSAPTFSDHPQVMDGCSDLLVELFGIAGAHVRTSVGVASTPNQIPVEIEAIVEVRE